MPTILSIVIVLFAINGIAFWMFYWDKWCAQENRQRIPETSLLFVALIGGSIGAIWAQQKFRHKTRKEPFRSLLFGIAALQCLIVCVLCVAPLRKATINTLGGPYRSACVERFMTDVDMQALSKCLGRS